MNASETEKKPYAVVVGVDYSELSNLALERACELAKAQARAELHVIHVEPIVQVRNYVLTDETLTTSLEDASARLHEHVEKVVERWCDVHATAAPFERLTTHVRTENPAEAIAQLASDVEADLVVVGTHGRRGAQRFLLGSVAEGTVRLAPCEVLVVRTPDASVPKIEPPCQRCLETRQASGGKEFWCEQHREQHGRRHTYHYRAAAGARQSGFLIHVR